MIFYNVVLNMKFTKGKVMNFVTGNFDIVGTHLQGTINTSYNRLVDVFGKPTEFASDDGKVQAEWAIKFNDGTLATVYDWKEDKSMYEVREWHIGGYSDAAVMNVVDEVI